MVCPKCGKENLQYVINSRSHNDGYIRRRRECLCGFRFSTIEMYDLDDAVLKAIKAKMKRSGHLACYRETIKTAYQKMFGGGWNNDGGRTAS